MAKDNSKKTYNSVIYLIYSEMKDQKITIEEMSAYMGVHRESVRNWLSGKTVPKFDAVLKMLTYIGYTMEAKSV